ncbi:MAG TPA: cupin domain-containing protein [Nitrospiraceae bacterium]|nr:cupin domain-containing protein [Nitrospiraceae bacterium]
MRILFTTATTVFCVLAAGALAQDAPPQESKGAELTVLTSIDLGPEIDGMQGRQLRMRKVTVAPGGVIGLHSHADRPTVVYVLEGTVTLHYEGKPDSEHAAGESFAEDKTTTHWSENKGSVPLVLLVTDIVKQ